MSDAQNDDRKDTMPGASNAADSPDNAENDGGKTDSDTTKGADIDVHGEPENPAG